MPNELRMVARFLGDAGGRDFIPKPFTAAELVTALASSHVCAVMFFFRFIPPRYIAPWGRVAAFGMSGLSLLGFLGGLWLGFEVGITLQELAGIVLPLLLAWWQGDTAAR